MKAKTVYKSDFLKCRIKDSEKYTYQQKYVPIITHGKMKQLKIRVCTLAFCFIFILILFTGLSILIKACRAQEANTFTYKLILSCLERFGFQMSINLLN